MGIPIRCVTDKMMRLMNLDQKLDVMAAKADAQDRNPARYGMEEALVFLSEGDMQDWFEAQCKRRGFIWVRSRMDRATTVQLGLPDFQVFYQGKGIMLEFKFGKNTPTRAQNAFLQLAKAAGVPAKCFWSAYDAWAWTLEQFGLTE